MNKIFKNKSLLVFSIVLVVVVGLGGVARANLPFSEILADKIANVIGEKLAVSLGIMDEGMLGSSGTRFPNGLSADTTSPIAGEVRGTTFTSTGAASFGGATTLTGAVTLDGNITLTDGTNSSAYFYEVIDFTNATYTQAVFDADALGYDDYYLIDVWIENTSKATSTVRIAVTTTTATVIASDDADTLDGDAGAATLMKTLGNAFGADGATFDSTTATGSEFFMLQFPGDSDELAAGANFYPLLVNSTTNILVYATSTEPGAILDGTNQFDGKLYIRGMESTR